MSGIRNHDRMQIDKARETEIGSSKNAFDFVPLSSENFCLSRDFL
jgi:hypothetical protein